MFQVQVTTGSSLKPPHIEILEILEKNMYHPPKLTWIPKMMIWKRGYLHSNGKSPS